MDFHEHASQHLSISQHNLMNQYDFFFLISLLYHIKLSSIRASKHCVVLSLWMRKLSVFTVTKAARSRSSMKMSSRRRYVLNQRHCIHLVWTGSLLHNNLSLGLVTVPGTIHSGCHVGDWIHQDQHMWVMQ